MFVGGFVLFAAVIVWMIGLLMSPHGESVAEGTEHVREAIVVYLRNSALATIGMGALAAFLLFPARRPEAPKRNWAIGLLIALLIGTSLYQLYWLRAAVS
jgi:hypothetical protein